jgi:hypothetical protein
MGLKVPAGMLVLVGFGGNVGFWGKVGAGRNACTLPMLAFHGFWGLQINVCENAHIDRELARMLALFVIRFGFATYVETLAAKSNAVRMHH